VHDEAPVEDQAIVDELPVEPVFKPVLLACIEAVAVVIVTVALAVAPLQLTL
jgi:hypothetical protein